MKKFLALILALCMIFALASVALADEEITPDDIPDNMESEDGTYELAFVTDVGQLKDKSFNQSTYDGVKLAAEKYGVSYKYYQPANGDQATDDDRYDAMKAAAEAGAKVVVCAGFMQGTALTKAAIDYPEVNFVFIDGWALTDEAGEVLTNVAGIAFKEEQCGYLAGYAVVRDGYTALGFCGGGGGTNPACCRYGYGFLQGAAAAAEELDTPIEVNYSWLYGASFSASPELQTMANGWYENGTEVIFAAGGSMFASIVAAAAENDAAVIGVDVDQSFESDTVITSALKGVSAATIWSIDKFYDGTWEEIGGENISLGAVEDAVGLPVDTWSLEGITVEEYEGLLEAIKAGELEIDNEYPEMGDITSLNSDFITVNFVE